MKVCEGPPTPHSQPPTFPAFSVQTYSWVRVTICSKKLGVTCFRGSPAEVFLWAQCVLVQLVAVH